MRQARSERVVFQPNTQAGLHKGINQMVELIRPTLGPYARHVAVERTSRNEAAELLDDAGTITRRVIQLADRDADPGAMLVRHLLWHLHEQVGDGTATAAVLFQSVYNQGLRYVAAGGNAMMLRRYLERGAQVIVDELSSMTVRLAGKAKLVQTAESICHDPALASVLGEIFDIVGEHGHVEIRRGHGRDLERHYVEGMHWGSGVFSAHMYNDAAARRADLQDVAILISDLEIDDPRQLVPVVDVAVTAGVRTLVIVASQLSEHAIALLLQASREPERFQAIAVKTPGLGTLEQAEAMQDLAVLTGGRPLLSAAGDALSSCRAQHLGRARKVWADQSYFGVVAGKGDPHALRRHIAGLRAALDQTEDRESRTRLQQRIGKLMGGSAALLIGARTEAESDAQVEVAQRTANALRAALREGIVLGGGKSLLLCLPKLRDMRDSAEHPDERVAYQILIKALEQPLRTIVENAGYDPGAVMAQVGHAPPESGFDVRSGSVVDLAEVGIFDLAAAQKAAARGAITAAAQALTIDVLIHPWNPQVVGAP